MDIFQHHNGVIHHQADGQHQAKQGQHIHREPKNCHGQEGRHDGNGNGNHGNNGGAHRSQEKKNNPNHKGKRNHQRVLNLIDRLRDKQAFIIGDHCLDPWWQGGLDAFQFRLHAICHRERIGGGLAQNTKPDGRPAIDAVAAARIFGPHFNARHFTQQYLRAARTTRHHNLAELVRRAHS